MSEFVFVLLDVARVERVRRGANIVLGALPWRVESISPEAATLVQEEKQVSLDPGLLQREYEQELEIFKRKQNLHDDQKLDEATRTLHKPVIAELELALAESRKTLVLTRVTLKHGVPARVDQTRVVYFLATDDEAPRDVERGVWDQQLRWPTHGDSNPTRLFSDGARLFLVSKQGTNMCSLDGKVLSTLDGFQLRLVFDDAFVRRADPSWKFFGEADKGLCIRGENGAALGQSDRLLSLSSVFRTCDQQLVVLHGPRGARQHLFFADAASGPKFPILFSFGLDPQTYGRVTDFVFVDVGPNFYLIAMLAEQVCRMVRFTIRGGETVADRRVDESVVFMEWRHDCLFLLGASGRFSMLDRQLQSLQGEPRLLPFLRDKETVLDAAFSGAQLAVLVSGAVVLGPDPTLHRFDSP
jgi:hypothetical protein